jgi:hypothetical protein
VRVKSSILSLTALLLSLTLPGVVRAPDNSTGSGSNIKNQISSQFLQNAVQCHQPNGLIALAGAAATLNSSDIGSFCGGGFSEQLAQSNITIFSPSDEARERSPLLYVYQLCNADHCYDNAKPRAIRHFQCLCTRSSYMLPHCTRHIHQFIFVIRFQLVRLAPVFGQ